MTLKLSLDLKGSEEEEKRGEEAIVSDHDCSVGFVN